MTPTVSIHNARTDATPQSLGFNPQRLDLLDEHFERLIESNGIQGVSYLIYRDGQIAVHRVPESVIHVKNIIWSGLT